MNMPDVFKENRNNKHRFAFLVFGLFLLLILARAGLSGDIQQSGGQWRTEHFYRDGIVTLLADSQEQVAKNQYHIDRFRRHTGYRRYT
jgi:hypothetical protein